jgi:hypothetical protein
LKNEIYKVILFISLFLFSCNHDTKNTARRTGDNYIKNPEQCFIAVYRKDTAFLRFKTMPKGKIQGRLVIKYAEPEPNALEKEFYHGEITGKFTKDTLFADYVFADGKNRTLYRNPIALLRINNKLVLGFGAIVNYLGRSWFIHRRAINFNKSRFQFVPTKCNN